MKSLETSKKKYFVKRDRMDILSSIVVLCQNPIPKTHVMYKCNLSYTQLNNFLDFLLQTGLIKREITNDGNHYRPQRKVSSSPEDISV